MANLYPGQQQQQHNKKMRKVKHDDIRAMIYPQIQTKDSLKLAISELERYNVQSGGVNKASNIGVRRANQRIKEFNRAQNQRDQQLLTAPVLASTQIKPKKSQKNKKHLTIVNQRQEEYEQISEPGSTQKMNQKSPSTKALQRRLKEVVKDQKGKELTQSKAKYGGVINLVQNQILTESEIMEAEQLQQKLANNNDQLEIRESQFEQIENIEQQTFSNFPYQLLDNSSSPAIKKNQNSKNNDQTKLNQDATQTNKNISFQSNKVDVTQFIYQQGASSSQNTTPVKGRSDQIEEQIQQNYGEIQDDNDNDDNDNDDANNNIADEDEPQDKQQQKVQFQKHQNKIKNRIAANNFGASFGHEVKKVQDLVKGDQMCKAFSIALLRHIQFSKARFHIDELNMIVDEPDALQFSYNLGNSLLKFRGYKNNNMKQKEEAKESNNRNFAELQRRLASGSSVKNIPSPPSTTTSAKSQIGKGRYSNIDEDVDSDKDDDEQQKNIQNLPK